LTVPVPGGPIPLAWFFQRAERILEILVFDDNQDEPAEPIRRLIARIALWGMPL
jgi:hypothetical protein